MLFCFILCKREGFSIDKEQQQQYLMREKFKNLYPEIT